VAFTAELIENLRPILRWTDENSLWSVRAVWASGGDSIYFILEGPVMPQQSESLPALRRPPFRDLTSAEMCNYDALRLCDQKEVDALYEAYTAARAEIARLGDQFQANVRLSQFNAELVAERDAALERVKELRWSL
jgi:hypothetical protein